jgi:flavorubredoxin
MLRTLLKIGLILVIILAIATGLILSRIGKPIERDIEVKNEAGTEVVLMVHHPGLTGFLGKVMEAFSEGMVSIGYRVEMTTASPRAPTDISKYDLLVLGSPTYGGNASKPLSDYLTTLGDLGEMSVVVIATGLGNATAASHMEKLVVGNNGIVVLKLGYAGMGANADILDDARTQGESM